MIWGKRERDKQRCILCGHESRQLHKKEGQSLDGHDFVFLSTSRQVHTSTIDMHSIVQCHYRLNQSCYNICLLYYE